MAVDFSAEASADRLKEVREGLRQSDREIPEADTLVESALDQGVTEVVSQVVEESVAPGAALLARIEATAAMNKGKRPVDRQR